MTRYLLAGAMVAAGLGFLATPVTPAAAQGVRVDAPGVHVGVGERHRYHERRTYMRDDRFHGCKTVTIRRDDGSVKQIRKCG